MVAMREFGAEAKVREMLLFDYNFSVEFGRARTGYRLGSTT